MSAIELKFGGGEKMRALLSSMAAAVGGARQVRVGFLENATYPATAPTKSAAAQRATSSVPLHVAQVAFWNEFGTIRAPARPFFRNMIRAQSPAWGDDLGNFLRSTEYDATRTLNFMGIEIQDQLKDSINEWPADNAPSTVEAKGFNKGLIHHSIMLRSADYEVLS